MKRMVLLAALLTVPAASALAQASINVGSAVTPYVQSQQMRVLNDALSGNATAAVQRPPQPGQQRAEMMDDEMETPSTAEIPVEDEIETRDLR